MGRTRAMVPVTEVKTFLHQHILSKNQAIGWNQILTEELYLEERSDTHQLPSKRV
jgi:hypothetical protein